MRKVFLLGIFAILGMIGRVDAQICVQPPSGLVSWWPGDGNANDIIGTHNGALQNGTTFAPGMVGQAFSFDGVDDFVEVPDSDLWTFGTNDFTIDLWVNFDSVRSSTIPHPQAVFIGHDEGPGDQNKWTFAFGGGVLYWHINSPTSGPIFLVLAPFSPVVNRWYHLAVTRSASTYTIFVDGIPISSDTDTHAVPNANAPLTIGQSESAGTGQNFFMHGRIDEVEIFNRALSASEIQAIFAADSAGKCKVQVVQIDIKPGSFPNAIKLGETGSIPVAIFSTVSFDATTIDVATLTLEGASVRIVRGKGLMASFEDVNQDGLLDLVVHFDRGELQLTAGDTTATVTGATTNGTRIEGRDSVKVIE